MAVNLIDRTKLDACLDAEADAIRAKTGDSNDISFDFANNKGFADAIAAIPSGGGGITPEYYEYTQAEAWTTDATGNAVTFCNTFLNHGYGLYRAVVENNTGMYNAQRATLFRFGGTYSYIGANNTSSYGSFKRSTNTSNSITPNTSVSFYLNAGAVIKVYHYPTFEEGDFEFPS